MGDMLSNILRKETETARTAFSERTQTGFGKWKTWSWRVKPPEPICPVRGWQRRKQIIIHDPAAAEGV